MQYGEGFRNDQENALLHSDSAFMLDSRSAFASYLSTKLSEDRDIALKRFRTG